MSQSNQPPPTGGAYWDHGAYYELPTSWQKSRRTSGLQTLKPILLPLSPHQSPEEQVEALLRLAEQHRLSGKSLSIEDALKRANRIKLPYVPPQWQKMFRLALTAYFMWSHKLADERMLVSNWYFGGAQDPGRYGSGYDMEAQFMRGAAGAAMGWSHDVTMAVGGLSRIADEEVRNWDTGLLFGGPRLVVDIDSFSSGTPTFTIEWVNPSWARRDPLARYKQYPSLRGNDAQGAVRLEEGYSWFRGGQYLDVLYPAVRTRTSAGQLNALSSWLRRHEQAALTQRRGEQARRQADKRRREAAELEEKKREQERIEHQKRVEREEEARRERERRKYREDGGYGHGGSWHDGWGSGRGGSGSSGGGGSGSGSSGGGGGGGGGTVIIFETEVVQGRRGGR